MADKSSQKKEKVQERAREIALSVRLGSMAELDRFYLRSLEFDVSATLPDSPFDVEVTIAPAASNVEAGSIAYEVAYEIKAIRGDAVALSMSCVYVASYEVPEDAEISREEIEAFGSTTVLYALHPSVRELVHNVTSRTVLGPLTLGTMRLPVELSEILAASMGS